MKYIILGTIVGIFALSSYAVIRNSCQHRIQRETRNIILNGKTIPATGPADVVVCVLN